MLVQPGDVQTLQELGIKGGMLHLMFLDHPLHAGLPVLQVERVQQQGNEQVQDLQQHIAKQ